MLGDKYKAGQSYLRYSQVLSSTSLYNVLNIRLNFIFLGEGVQLVLNIRLIEENIVELDLLKFSEFFYNLSM